MFSEFIVLIIFEKSEVSLAKILHIDLILSGKSFIYINNKSEPNIHCGKPESIFL